MPDSHAPLTEAQVRQFGEEGCLVLPEVFSPQETAAMAAEADRLLEMAINCSLALGGRSPRLDALRMPDDAETLDVRKLQPVNDLSELFRRVSGGERLLGPLRQLLGAEPVLMEEKLNYKQRIACPVFLQRIPTPVGDDRFFLHHDWGYYRMQGYPPEILSSAIAIDEVTSAKGPLRVLPGSHKREWPLKDPDPAHGLGIVRPGLVPESDLVEVLAPAGSVLIFHSLLLHDSPPNRTREPRRILILSHYPDTFSFEEDARNRTGRAAAQRAEARYRAMLAQGAYEDEFRLGNGEAHSRPV